MRPLALILVLLIVLAPPAQSEQRVPRSDAEITLSFAPVAREASKAVVNIYTRRVIARQVSPFAGDPFFSQFFGLERSIPRVENSLGSGVIVSGEGIVVSNYHVVGGASEIRVVLSDRREFDGEVLLADEQADLAVIRLQGAADLPALVFGDADSMEVGDLVLAIGNPFGIGQTVTSGIVSGLARTGTAIGANSYYLQTDAPINPGNSGGALVDMRGHLIGINTSILTRSGGSNGIGFAIPANLVRQYVEQAQAGATEFVRPWSGMNTQVIDHDMAQALGLAVPEGVLVTQVHPDSPFAAAGVARGDVLLSIDGHGVNGPAELEYRIATIGPQRSVAVSYLRAGEIRTGEALLTEAEGEVTPVQVAARTFFDGLLLADVTPRLIQELDLPLDSSGVVVLQTDGYSVRSGLRPGDLVLAVNNAPVVSAEDLREVLSVPNRAWRLQVKRGGQNVVLEMRG